MSLMTNRSRPDRRRDDSRSAHRREMVQGLLLLAILIVLAVLSRLPAA
jgi:hypothetical protein